MDGSLTTKFLFGWEKRYFGSALKKKRHLNGHSAVASVITWHRLTTVVRSLREWKNFMHWYRMDGCMIA